MFDVDWKFEMDRQMRETVSLSPMYTWHFSLECSARESLETELHTPNRSVGVLWLRRALL